MQLKRCQSDLKRAQEQNKAAETLQKSYDELKRDYDSVTKQSKEVFQDALLKLNGCPYNKAETYTEICARLCRVRDIGLRAILSVCP